MESRGGGNAQARAANRPAIARRSCDPCRIRKVGCDRKSPCSNCVSARLDCTHSAVASHSTLPKQRVLISAQYEQKIDDIAQGIDGIKLLLGGLNVDPKPQNGSTWHPTPVESVPPPNGLPSVPTSNVEPLWDHSAHIIDFIRAVIDHQGPRNGRHNADSVHASLQELVQMLERPVVPRDPSLPKPLAVGQTGPPMPPLDAVIAVLRWAKDHTHYTRIAWMARALPLERFTEICRKVYFAVDDYSEIDLILANGYLSYVFFEHDTASGSPDYQAYCRLCRENLHAALLRLPFLLPASMEVIAALILGALNSIENSKATAAWAFISKASDLSQSLGYHKLRRNIDESQRAAQESLFWCVNKLEKGISLRLGRASTIRDAEVTIPYPAEARTTRVARVQGQIYDQLYSPAGLSLPEHEREQRAQALADELRELLHESHAEILEAASQAVDGKNDPMRVVYLRCDLVCQSSILALILRALPTPSGAIHEDCVAVARETLDIHQQCMETVRGVKGDPSMVSRYISWSIMNTPFVPFSILFTRAVQFSDSGDIELLEHFAASLKPDTNATESMTHPYRLYDLLCQAARLCVDSNPPGGEALTLSLPDSDFELTHLGLGSAATASDCLDGGSSQTYGLGDWYYSNQQIMNMMDDDILFC